MQVGDYVYLKPVNNAARYGKHDIVENIIKKVGRKYFEVWDGEHEYTITKFHLDTKRQVTNYSPDWILYFSKQEVINEQEHNKIISEIRKVFEGWSKVNLSLEQLREIKKIIDEGKENRNIEKD